MMENLNRKFMTAEEALEVLFHNDYAYYNSDFSSNNIHESNSDISTNSDYNGNQVVNMFTRVSFSNQSLRWLIRSMQMLMYKIFL